LRASTSRGIEVRQGPGGGCAAGAARTADAGLGERAGALGRLRRSARNSPGAGLAAPPVCRSDLTGYLVPSIRGLHPGIKRNRGLMGCASFALRRFAVVSAGGRAPAGAVRST